MIIRKSYSSRPESLLNLRPNLNPEFRSPGPTQCAAVAVRSPNRNQTPAPPPSPMLLAVPAMLMGFNFVLINLDLFASILPMRDGACYDL